MMAAVRPRPLALALALALASALLLVAASARDCSPEDVLWLWPGALSSNAITFTLGLRDGHNCRDRQFVFHATPERLRDDEKPHSSVVSCYATAPVAGGPAPAVLPALPQEPHELGPAKACVLADLPHANRRYRYSLALVPAARHESNLIVRRGSFTTPPVDGTPFSFRFAFSSCADEDSDPRVFTEIAAQWRPLFLLHMGDLHYHNIEVNDVSQFRAAYHSLLTSPSGRAMLEMDIPITYMWDDHDYGPDNSDRTAPGRNASLQVYREFVPHYELPGDATEGPRSAVYQSFTIGRVHFILTDLRSHRTPNLARDAPSKSVLGAKQKKWFKEELVRATNDARIALIVWCSTMPWHDDERKWGYFRHEQQEIIEYMQGHGVNRWKRVVIVSGDAHMLAVDDGSHTPGNLTLFHAAALGRPGSIKGGPYSHGVFAGSGQYGIMDVEDDGTKVCLRFQGVRMGSGVLLEYDVCHPERTPPNATYVPPPIAVRKMQRSWKKIKRRLVASSWLLLGGGAALVLFVLVVGLPCVWPRRGRGRARSEKED
ncbi:hypothetical protein ATCC90586_000308 [Pythium insidiosum]|nr:hypothetical protein ATCC90586_000308 [Pythium insidiosum]